MAPCFTRAVNGRLSVERIEGPLQLAQLRHEVERLSASMCPRLPFATVDWMLSWWQLFGEKRALVRDRFFVHALRDEQGTLVALAPLLLTERPATGPLRVRMLTFFGVDKNITELRGLICAPANEAAAVEALLAHLSARADEWDWLVWDGVRQGGLAHRMLSGLRDFDWRRETPSYVLELPATWEEFRATRPRNVKEALRKCYNSLARDQHSFGFHAVTEASALPGALERFFRLHRQRARAPELVPHADYFSLAHTRQLLLELARTPQRAPALHVFELTIGGHLVASRVGFLLGDELYLYFSGFDPAWARYSVMTTTVAEAIKWAILRKLRIVNLSAGTDVSKTRWRPHVVTTCSGVLLAPHRSARLKWHLAKRVEENGREGAWLSRVVKLARRRG